jgi:hypothetical protein
MFHDEYFRAIKAAMEDRRKSWVDQLISQQTPPDRTAYLRGCITALDATLHTMRQLNDRIERAEAA